MDLEELLNELTKAEETNNMRTINTSLVKLGLYYQKNNDIPNMFKYYEMGIKNNDNPVEIDGEVIYTYEITNDKTHDYYFNDTNFVLTLPMYEKTPIIPYFNAKEEVDIGCVAPLNILLYSFK